MTWFGSHEVLYELRSGGMGKVLLGRRRGPGGFEKLVAIKTTRTDLAAVSQLRAMFLDEAAILARLNHPAVATVHDFGEIDGALYLVMEYVAGVPLHSLIGRNTPPLIAAQILAQACRGIHAAHELRDLSGQLLGVVHRDISPDNLLIDFDGHVKVIDFGIALVKGRQAAVTEIGMLKGKPPYMSPEQIKNEAIDRRSDLFSLGVVLWELLTGQLLFGGDSLYAIARAVEDQPIAAPSTIVGALPPGLDAVVMRALARDPSSRFATAAEMAEKLEGIVAAESGESLESYCARTLAEERESHRQWLGSVLGGAGQVPMGRPTGTVTAVADLPLAPTANLQSAYADPRARVTPTPVVSLDAGTGRAKKRRSVLVAASMAVIAALAVAGWRFVATSEHSHSNVGVAQIGRTSSPEVAPRDNLVAVPGDTGGGLPLRSRGSSANPDPTAARTMVTRAADAANPRPVRRDAASSRTGADTRNRPHREAASAATVVPVASRRRDAAAVMALPVEPPSTTEPDSSTPVATGYLKVTAHPFAYVSIDDGSVVSTPILKAPLPAGSHKVVLTDPSSGNRLLERTVTIVAGQLTTISSP